MQTTYCAVIYKLNLQKEYFECTLPHKSITTFLYHHEPSDFFLNLQAVYQNKSPAWAISFSLQKDLTL